MIITSDSSASEKREPLVIGLVNSMPDAALKTTEEQFRELLGAASGEHELRLRLFSFPELIRGEEGRAHIAEYYEPIDTLWNGELDGLIVTGAEPRTPALPDELYWASLTRLVDRASMSETPTVWSCLAAHAAVLYLDGIERRRLERKISGVFTCARVADDGLVAGVPRTWRLPHSRLNTLDPAALLAAGYKIVSFSDEAGVDAFVLRRGAPFVFYQGHPEYDAGALSREYRRDVRRFLAGTSERYPELPYGYFDGDVAQSLNAFRARAQHDRARELLGDFPESRQTQTVHVWRDAAVQLYRNWISMVADRRSDAALTAAAVMSARSS